MMRSRSLRWIASLATVVLLVPGCDSSDDVAADTTRAATTAAPTTTTTAAPTTTVAASALSVDQAEGTTITVSLDAVEGLGGHVVSAWVLPLEPNDDKDAIGGTFFGTITDDPFSDSRKIQPQNEDRPSEVTLGESSIVEPGTYRFIIEGYVPSGPMHYGCEMPIDVDGREPLVIPISSLPTYTGEGWHWTPPGREFRYPDCPVEPFDFSTQSLCDWFSPEDIDAIVTSTYEELGVPLDRGYEMHEEQDQTSECSWALPLLALHHNEEIESRRPFVSHPALDESVRVSIQGDGSYGLMYGIGAVLTIDGHPEQLWFVHGTQESLIGDVEMINTLGFTIANKMLQQMGWIETN